MSDKTYSWGRNLWNLLRKASFTDLFQPKKLKAFYAVWPYTMLGYHRLANAWDLVGRIQEEGIVGDIVECGVWKGGCSALMAERTRQFKPQRTSWLFDSFEELPKPSQEKKSMAKEYTSSSSEGNLATIGRCESPLTTVKELLFTKLQLDSCWINIINGHFQDTLPETSQAIGQIALLRLDGDSYDFTMVCFENLYEKVAPGGYIILDDYLLWEGCKKATDEFLAKHNIKAEIHIVDQAGAYFKKP